MLYDLLQCYFELRVWILFWMFMYEFVTHLNVLYFFFKKSQCILISTHALCILWEELTKIKWNLMDLHQHGLSYQVAPLVTNLYVTLKQWKCLVVSLDLTSIVKEIRSGKCSCAPSHHRLSSHHRSHVLHLQWSYACLLKSLCTLS